MKCQLYHENVYLSFRFISWIFFFFGYDMHQFVITRHYTIICISVIFIHVYVIHNNTTKTLQNYLHTARLLSVPDEGYFRHASCALNLISTFLFLVVRL